MSCVAGKAFRHGDIESVLENLAKTAGRPGGGSLLGFAASVLSSATGGKKFNRMDIKRVYFVRELQGIRTLRANYLSQGELASRLLPGAHV